MYNIWPLLIISISFLIIIFIVFRHFPALAVLDVDNISEEKEQQIKEKIIKERIRRKFYFFDKFFDNVLRFLNNLSNIFWSKLGQLEKEQKEKEEEKNLADVSLDERIKILFSQANDFIKKEDWIEAEKKLIEIIKLDDKNFSAFLELGEVYHSEEKWQEAKQTLLYAVKLAEVFPEKNDSGELNNLNYSLALINKELNDISGAISHISQSLKLDPNNPRYLDLMLDLCIIKKDKNLAQEFLNKIKEVNPGNNNIFEWEEQINEMDDFN